MKAHIIIPARLQSGRLPGKLLLPVAGRPLLWHTWHAATRSRAAAGVTVATDAEEIAAAVRGWGGAAVMTSPDHPHGSSRCAEAARGLPPDVRYVVNWQADEPLVGAADVDRLLGRMTWHPGVPVWTLAQPLADGDRDNPSVVKVALSDTLHVQARALYFSRAPLAGAWHHVGVYAFQRWVLYGCQGADPAPPVRAEGLEQLHFLARGQHCGVIPVTRHSFAVNTPADYERLTRHVSRLARAA